LDPAPEGVELRKGEGLPTFPGRYRRYPDQENPGAALVDELELLEGPVVAGGWAGPDAADLTRLFALLRANDLIWSSGISSYLLAEDAIASDLLYWFADGIGMPGKMLRTFMRSVILENGLAKPGGLTIGGNPINVKDIRTPLCFVSLRDDHVAGWQDTYRGARQFH